MLFAAMIKYVAGTAWRVIADVNMSYATESFCIAGRGNCEWRGQQPAACCNRRIHTKQRTSYMPMCFSSAKIWLAGFIYVVHRFLSRKAERQKVTVCDAGPAPEVQDVGWRSF